jgi:hypothetical protein
LARESWAVWLFLTVFQQKGFESSLPNFVIVASAKNANIA